MPNRLVYAGIGRVAGCDATVLGNYAPASAGRPEDASTVVTRKDPPREKLRLGPAYAHLEPAAHQIVALMDQGPGCPNRDVLQAVMRFLSFHGRMLGSPAVTPTSDGGIQLEWFHRGVGVELEFDPDGDLVVLIDHDGEIESSVAVDLTDAFLLAALRFVRLG